jgi:hypothetical protein
MSLFGQTLILYLVVGAGVAGAVYLTPRGGRLPGRWFLVVTAVLFWPLYLTVLLSSGRAGQVGPTDAPAPDEMAAAIHQVNTELTAALEGLDGWAEEVFLRERARLRDLSAAWLAQAQRIRDMDRVLAQLEYVGEDIAELSKDDTRLQSSRQARRENVERLRRLRRRAHDDLMGSLAWVRELVSMIHLARFSGAPAARAEELVAQIAAAVEGLSELTWQEGTSIVETADG